MAYADLGVPSSEAVCSAFGRAAGPCHLLLPCGSTGDPSSNPGDPIHYEFNLGNCLIRLSVRCACFGPGLWPGPCRQAGWAGSDAQGRVPEIVSAKRLETTFGCP